MRWFWTQLILFQLLWFTSVMGKNEYLLVGILLLAIHFVFTPTLKHDLLLLPLAVIGIFIDALLTYFSVFNFNQTPYWLGLIWLGFILSIPHSLSWLSKVPTIALVFIGALAGPVSYVAGLKLNAVTFSFDFWITCAIIASIWGVLLPNFVSIETRLRKVV